MGLKDEVPNSLFQNGLLLLLMCRFLFPFLGGAKRPLHNIKFNFSLFFSKPLIRNFCIQNFYFWSNYLGNLERLACL